MWVLVAQVLQVCYKPEIFHNRKLGDEGLTGFWRLHIIHLGGRLNFTSVSSVKGDNNRAYLTSLLN